MNKNDYKAAFNSVKFSENFEQDTIEDMLRAADLNTKKEKDYMKAHKTIKTTILAAAIVAALAISALALTMLLSPKEVATQIGDKALSKAFDSENAVTIDKSEKSGDYTILLLGIVSGKGLTDYCKEAQEDKSYIVASVAYTDGRKIAQAGETGITFSPLVSGYKPWQVNAWTLGGGGYQSFLYEGIDYYIFECSNLEIFADHTVYLAAYEGSAPSAETFKMSEDGMITYTDTFKAPHAMFTLPLDSSKANPEAVKNLFKNNGIVIQ